MLRTGGATPATTTHLITPAPTAGHLPAVVLRVTSKTMAAAQLTAVVLVLPEAVEPTWVRRKAVPAAAQANLDSGFMRLAKRIGLALSAGLGEFCHVRLLPVQLAALALLVACGPGETPPPPVESTPAPVTKPATEPTPAAETRPTPEPTEPAPPPTAAESLPDPVAEPEPEPAKPIVTEPATAPAAQSKPAPESVTAAPSIRKPKRERFIEEDRLELKEQRWHVIGEPEPYTGQTKRWTIEGWKQAEGGYKNGMQHGRWKTWWDNGNLRSAIEFKNGKPSGPAIHWHASGQRKTEGTFVNGKFTAMAKWDESGEALPLDPTPKP